MPDLTFKKQSYRSKSIIVKLTGGPYVTESIFLRVELVIIDRLILCLNKTYEVICVALSGHTAPRQRQAHPIAISLVNVASLKNERRSCKAIGQSPLRQAH